MKMNELFEFTSAKMDKKLFESLKDYNIPNDETKAVLQRFLKDRNPKMKYNTLCFLRIKAEK
jgi:hypothetical protein